MIPLSRQNLAVAEFASKDPTRSTLQHVQVLESGVTVATDGRTLAICAPETPTPKADLEKLPGPEAGLISAKTAQMVAKKLPTHGSGANRRELPAICEYEKDELQLILGPNNKLTPGAACFTEPQGCHGAFPDWLKVITQPERQQTRFNMSLSILKGLVKLLQASGLPDDQPVTFEVPANSDGSVTQPITFRAKPTEQTIFGLLMPMHSTSAVKPDDCELRIRTVAAERSALRDFYADTLLSKPCRVERRDRAPGEITAPKEGKISRGRKKGGA